MRTGIYNGETSIVYGYLCIYRITKDIRYLEYAVRHAEFVIEAIDNEEGCDLLEGLAGAVWGMVMLYEVKGEEKYLKAAEKAGGQVVAEGQSYRRWCGMEYTNRGTAIAWYGAWKCRNYDSACKSFII